MKTLPEYIWSKLEIASQLRDRMYQLCLTQDKLATDAEIGIAHLNSILCAKVLPRFDTLLKIVERMGCTLEIRIVPKKDSSENIRFKKLARSYWECDFAKLSPQEMQLLRQYYMISLEDEYEEDDNQIAA